MSKASIHDLIARLELSSPDAEKYAELTGWLAAHLGVDSVRCKALADPKNVANRLREVASLDVELLVLLVSEQVPEQLLDRLLPKVLQPNGTISSALVIFPNKRVVLVGGDDKLVERATRALGSIDHRAAKPSIGRVARGDTISWAVPRPVPPGLLSDALLASRSSTKLTAFEEWIANQAGADAHHVVAKVIVDLKNAGNRISEALGLQPAVLVLVLACEDAESVSRVLGRRIRDEGVTVLYAERASNGSTDWIVRAAELPRNHGSTPQRSDMPARASSEKPSPPLSAEPGLKVNAHVARLKRHLPLGANSKELYEEQRDPADRGSRQSIPTKAYDFVARLVGEPQTSLIVLTGDAGHGKTHLCRRLIVETCGLDTDDALDALRTDPLGERRFPQTNGGKSLRIVKDLSEIEPAEVAAETLVDLMRDSESVAVVCANEGRLRAVVDRLPSELHAVRASLDASVGDGLTSAADGVYIVNLNYQSVAAAEDRSFFGDLLKKWVHDGRSWAICRSCDAAGMCPILANRQFLASDGDNTGTPARRLLGLVQVVEQSGYVLTIRESLMFLAYALLGREDCSSVHERHGHRVEGGATLPSLLFEPLLQQHELEGLKVLERLRRLDPGRVALREVDDALLRALDKSASSKAGVNQELAKGPPRTKKEARDDQTRLRELLRAERRLAFFRETSEDVPFSRRLGLRWYGDFAAIATGAKEGADVKAAMRVRNRLVQGLHVVQGIRPQSEVELYLVDPAFSHGRGATSVIAARIPVRYVMATPQSADWKRRGSTAPFVVESVDWLDRRIVVRLGPDEVDGIALDLRQFEFLARAADGIAFREFHAADMRRLASRLALVVQKRPPDPERIVVMDGHVPRHLSIDVDDTFVVGEM